MHTRSLILVLLGITPLLMLIFVVVAVIAALFPYAVAWVLLFGGWLTPANN